MIKNLSVIIVTYNRAVKLEKCLDSLVLQLYPKNFFYVLVIDDGSEDKTQLVVNNYKKFLIIDYFYQKHQGVGAARRLGITKAKTDFVAFIDDDCVASKNWLIELMQLKMNKIIAAAGGPLKIKKPKNNFEKYVNHYLFGNGQNWQPTVYDPPFITTANSIYRRDIVKKIGNFDQALTVGEDLDMGWRLFFAGYKFGYLSRAVVYHAPPKNYFEHFKKIFNYGRGNAQVSRKHFRILEEYRKKPPKSAIKVEMKELIGFWPHVWAFLEDSAFKMGYRYEKLKK